VPKFSGSVRARALAEQSQHFLPEISPKLQTNKKQTATPHGVALHSPASALRLGLCTGDANSAVTRRKSMSRRIIVPAGNTEPEIRQRGYAYQKSRKQSDPWIPTQRAYGFFRLDVPGETKQKERRVALGFCRDRMSAMLKLHQAMQKAGVLNVEKIRERISPAVTFAEQAAWMVAEMQAGRIVNKKTGEPVGERTIDFYTTAIAYLNEVVRDKPLASLDNAAARDLVARMKQETLPDGSKRFGQSGKTIAEYFKTFQKVIASAADENGNQLHPRTWNLPFIGVPKVNKRNQHRPVLNPEEMSYIVANTRGQCQMAAALFAGGNIRISELLAFRIEKHISEDRTTLFIRQQRRKKGGIKHTLKSDAAYRDVDLYSGLAKMLSDYIGDRKEGFLFQTENGTMLSPESLYRGGFETLFKRMGRTRVRFHAFRRFREAVLLASDARQILIDYWMGHWNDEMSTRYGEQLLKNVAFRKQWAEKIGLGFELPKVSESESGLSCDTCATNSVEHNCSAALQMSQ
jgi:integrase